MKISIVWLSLMCTCLALYGSNRDAAETTIQVRLETAVSSQYSKAGDPIKASVRVPVTVGNRILIPMGAILTGKVDGVRQLNERRHRAGILMEFSEVQFSDGRKAPISGRVSEVDNARETVEEDGWIEGKRPFSLTPSKKTDVLILLAYAHPLPLAALGAMQILRREAAHLQVAYKAGVDLTLRTSLPADLAGVGTIGSPEPDAALIRLVDQLPTRTARPGDLKQGDFTNILLIGSLQEVQAAFINAGWTTSIPLNVKSGLHAFFATAEEHPYQRGPMAKFILHDRKQDLVFQKQNDTFAKRHHIRLWQESVSLNGRPVWIASATHDVAIGFSLFGFRHIVDPSIDLERQKIIDDLVYSGATFQGLVERPNVPTTSRNAVGDPLNTDGKIAVLSLKSGAGTQVASRN